MRRRAVLWPCWLSSRSLKADALSWHPSATAALRAEITMDSSLLPRVVAIGEYLLPFQVPPLGQLFPWSLTIGQKPSLFICRLT